MTEAQIQALGPALAGFLDRFLFCCADTRTFAHLNTYCRGLLSDLPRKSAEPIALAAGTPVRTFQEFLRDHLWDHDQVTRLLRRHVALLLDELPDDGLGVVLVVDETATPKKGDKTPGVQRQWCGRLGKQDNCVVTVHTAVCKGRYKALLDADLFLPQSWSDDRPRCRAAGIPDELTHRPKWAIALEQLDRALADALPPSWLTFDEGYGQVPQFLAGLDRRRLRFAGEVPKSWTCSTGSPQAGQPGRRADEVVRQDPAFAGKPWRRVRLERQTLGVQTWQVKAARVWPATKGLSGTQPYWLVWAVNEATGEEKYFVSNAGERVPVVTIVRAGFARWNVEHGLRLSKSELGFGHFEGRSYLGLMRHLTLCLLALAFVSGQASGLRGEKRRGDGGAGVPCAASGVRGLAGGHPGDGPVAVHGGDHPLSPAEEPASPRITTPETEETPLSPSIAL
jgi:SRSO17 transposase